MACDYIISKRGNGEGHSIHDEDGNYLTTIPHHRRVKWPVSRNILSVMAKGKSTYRKRDS